VPFVRGDAGCDGALDPDDLQRLAELIFDDDGAEGCAAADANGDGETDAADLLELLRLLTGGE
jgi:hypothetical protein